MTSATDAIVSLSAVGTYAGSFFRERIPERIGGMALKAGITFFAVKMIVDTLAWG